jgi:hypothetical protein
MKILVFYGLYEAEKSIAPLALGQLLRMLGDHQLDLVILDDASPSRLGDAMRARFEEAGPGRVDVLRLDRSTGYRGAIERTVYAFQQIVRAGREYDCVVRLDADVHFCRDDLAKLFEPGRLPRRGIVGQSVPMRARDFLLYLADATMPIGFQRRVGDDGRMEHGWELRRFRSVWWRDIGAAALLHGFRGRFVPGSFQVLAWETLAGMASRGWLDRPRAPLGLIFGEDIVTNSMVAALGHPIVDAQTIVPDWSCELFLTPEASPEAIRSRGHYFVHPVKDLPWANTLRQNLS